MIVLVTVACLDGCTGPLFDKVDRMAASISHLDVSDYVPLPWTGLLHYENTSILFEHTIVEKRREYVVIEELSTAPNILPLAHITLQRVWRLIIDGPTP